MPKLPSIRIPHIPFRMRVLFACLGIFGGLALLIVAFATNSLLLTFLALGGVGQGVATLLFPYAAYDE